MGNHALEFLFPFISTVPHAFTGERKGRVGAIFLTPTRKRNSKIKMEREEKIFTLSKKKIPPSHAFRGIKFQGNTPPPFCHIKELRRKYSNLIFKKAWTGAPPPTSRTLSWSLTRRSTRTTTSSQRRRGSAESYKKKD